MKFTRQSLYQLTCQNGLIHDQHGKPFDAQRYSQYKYGLGNAAETYAQEMADFLCFTHPYWFDESVVGLAASDYKAVPTASEKIAQYLIRFLAQKKTVKNPNCSIRPFKIHRTNVLEAEYGNLSQNERQKLMEKLELAIENTHFWTNRKIIVINDIWITGAHENRIRQLFSGMKVSEVLFLYIAELQGTISPTIEHSLDHAWVKNLEILQPFFAKSHGELTSPICEFLFSYPDRLALRLFFEGLQSYQLEKIRQAAEEEGYNQIPRYVPNFEVLLAVLRGEKMYV